MAAKCINGCGRDVETDVDMCDVCFHDLEPDMAHNILKQAKQDESAGRIPTVGRPNHDAERRWIGIKWLMMKKPKK